MRCTVTDSAVMPLPGRTQSSSYALCSSDLTPQQLPDPLFLFCKPQALMPPVMCVLGPGQPMQVSPRDQKQPLHTRPYPASRPPPP